MMEIVTLQSALLDLLRELEGTGIKLIIGGGFGIYLRIQHIKREGLKTLLQEWPEERSTNDLDLFLRPELIIRENALKPLKTALDNLKYAAIEGAKYLQFVKEYEAGSIKIDLLTGPQDKFLGTPVKVDKRRARPNPSVQVHAHPVDEAPTLEEGLLEVQLDFFRASQESCNSSVFIPHPYTYAMMKLFAFKDRMEDSEKDYGRHHALDIYSVLATTTEEEWNQALELSEAFSENAYVQKARELVRDLFADPDQKGILRLKENRYYRTQMEIEKFISIIKELFPG